MSSQTEGSAVSASETSEGVSGLVWRNAAAIGGARVGSVVLDGLAYVMTARYFGPAEYGHYISLLAFLNLVDIAADMMVMDIGVRQMSREPRHAGSWLAVSTLLRLALAGLGLLAYGVYIFVVGGFSGDLLRSAWIGALLLPVSALRMPLALFRARMKMHYELSVVLATRFVNLLLFGALIYSGGRMSYFFLAILTSRALLAVLAWGTVLAIFRVRLSVTRERFRHLIKESIPMGVSGFFVAVQLKADILIVASLTGAAAAGIYGAVAQLPEYSLYIPVIITTPMLPVLSKAFTDSAQKRFQVYYQKMFDVIVAAVIPLAVVAVVMPRAAVILLFGERYSEAAAVLPLLVLSIVAIWISHAMAIATVAAGLQSNFVWVQSICMAIYLLLDWFLIPSWGVAGAAVGRLVSALIAPVLTYFVIKRKVGFSLRTGELRRTALAGSGMAAAVLLCSSLPLAVAAAVGSLVYGMALWATRRSASLAEV